MTDSISGHTDVSPQGLSSYPSRAKWTLTLAAVCDPETHGWFLENTLSVALLSSCPSWGGPGQARDGKRGLGPAGRRALALWGQWGWEQGAGQGEAHTPLGPLSLHSIPVSGQECRQSLRVLGQDCPKAERIMECLLIDQNCPVESDPNPSTTPAVLAGSIPRGAVGPRD